MSGRLGLIVNPLAGLGGRVGLKGTDGAEIVRRALALGAEPVAPARAERALSRLDRHRDGLSIVTGARAMGGELAEAHRFRTEVVDAGHGDETTAADTRAAAAAMERRNVELILFAGGDGTGRDIVETVGTRVPILGIPTGVKMHSAIFATSPEAAGDLAGAHLCGRESGGCARPRCWTSTRRRCAAGRVSARLYAVAQVPYDRARVQSPKAALTLRRRRPRRALPADRRRDRRA